MSSRTSSGTKKKKAPAKKTPAKKASAAKKTAAKRPPVPKAREPMSPLAMAVIFGLSAIICLLSVIGAEGVLLGWLASFFKGAFGVGFYILPIALGYCAFAAYTAEDGRTRRLVSAGLVPVLIGAVVHSFGKYEYQTLKLLISDGVELASGGLVAGGIASLLIAAISRIGAALVLVAGCAALVISALNLSPRAIAEYFRRPDDDYEDPDGGDDYDDNYGEGDDYDFDELPVMQTTEVSAKPEFAFPSDRRKRLIDISLDSDGMPIGTREAEERARQFRIEPTIDQGLMDLDRPSDSPPSGLPERPEPIEPARVRPRPTERKKPAPKPADEPVPFMGEAVDLDQKRGYIFPPITLLEADTGPAVRPEAAEEIKRNSQRLIETLGSFGVDARIINVTRGPSVTRYEVQVSRGVKYSKVTSLSDDIALALAAQSVRIAPIPDKVAIGIEVPNRAINIVHIRDVIESQGFGREQSKISFAMGRDIAGEPIIGDIFKLTHLLVAGTTGSGKSVCINSILVSILYKAAPEEVKLIMIDPKMIELGVYNGIPHLLIPVVTDPKKAAGALQWALGEMMKRYKKMKDAGVRNLMDYNAWLRTKHKEGELLEEETLPQIVIVIDELADLMLVAANEVEEAICRLAQMARAAGMHLIIATQRPSADVITGLMKANIPSRIAFSVASQLESRIILDTMGAEKLIGRGDMLFNPIGSSKPLRVQGCFISSEEVESVVGFVKSNSEADYNEEVIAQVDRAAEQTVGNKKGGASAGDSDDQDAMFYEAVQVIMDTQQASASMLQRRLKLGYARASRLVDQMEERGIIGPFEGSKPRQILISKTEWMEMSARREL